MQRHAAVVTHPLRRRYDNCSILHELVNKVLARSRVEHDGTGGIKGHQQRRRVQGSLLALEGEIGVLIQYRFGSSQGLVDYRRDAFAFALVCFAQVLVIGKPEHSARKAVRLVGAKAVR